MLQRPVLALAFLLASIATPAAAQLTAEEEALFRQMEGTLFVKDHAETVQGRLRACGLEFAALTRDFSTKKGAPVKLIGSYYLRRFEGNGSIYYTLKLGVFEGPGLDKPSAPNSAFARGRSGEGPSKSPQKTGSDSPGFALFIGALDETFTHLYEGIVGENLFIVGFNRKPGETDVSAEIDLSVQDTRSDRGEIIRERSPRMVKQFVSCVGALANVR